MDMLSFYKEFYCLFSKKERLEPLQKFLHDKVCETIGRNGQLGYYDVTNYYFEIPYNDEDKYDEDKYDEDKYDENGVLNT